MERVEPGCFSTGVTTSCGAFGSCLLGEDGFERCVCAPGWEQTEELSKFVLSSREIR